FSLPTLACQPISVHRQGGCSRGGAGDGQRNRHRTGGDAGGDNGIHLVEAREAGRESAEQDLRLRAADGNRRVLRLRVRQHGGGGEFAAGRAAGHGAETVHVQLHDLSAFDGIGGCHDGVVPVKGGGDAGVLEEGGGGIGQRHRDHIAPRVAVQRHFDLRGRLALEFPRHLHVDLPRADVRQVARHAELGRGDVEADRDAIDGEGQRKGRQGHRIGVFAEVGAVDGNVRAGRDGTLARAGIDDAAGGDGGLCTDGAGWRVGVGEAGRALVYCDRGYGGG